MSFKLDAIGCIERTSAVYPRVEQAAMRLAIRVVKQCGECPVNRRKSEHQTRRHRLIGQNYSDPGYYFITFGTKNNRHQLGTCMNERMVLSPTGRELEQLITSLPDEIEQLELDCFVIMPNHVHILAHLFIDQEPITVSEIVRLIKGRSATIHRKIGDDPNGLLHKGFHDEIIRNELHLESVRRYIDENPQRWGSE